MSRRWELSVIIAFPLVTGVALVVLLSSGLASRDTAPGAIPAQSSDNTAATTGVVPAPPSAIRHAPPPYTQEHEQIYDVPAKTMVIRFFVLSRPATRDQVETILREEFHRACYGRRYRYRRAPNQVKLAVYTSRAKMDEGIGADWAGILLLQTDQQSPKLEFRETQLLGADTAGK